MRLETDPILSAVSTTEASGRELSILVLSEMLSHVGTPLYREEGPMDERSSYQRHTSVAAVAAISRNSNHNSK